MDFIKDIKKMGLVLIILIATSVFSVSSLGIKDGFMITMSVALIIIMFVISRKDMKKSMCIFLISMPILVTARKLFYLDLGLIKLNFESIMIIYFFSLNYKSTSNKIKTMTFTKSSKKLVYYSILLIIGSYVSCFFSKDIMKSFALNTTSILVPIMLMITIIGIFEKSDIKKIVYSLIVTINLSCFYGFIQMLNIGFNISAIKQARAYVTFGYHNTNIFVVIALLIYPLLLNELLYKKNNKKEKIFLIASLMIQTIAIALTFSRGAWLSLGLVFGAMLFSKKYRVVFLIISIVGVLSASTILPYIMSRGNSGKISILTNQSTTARIQSIFTSSEIMKENILGVGYGEFNNSYRDYADRGYRDIPEKIRSKMRSPFYTLENAHNFFLHIGVELGIVTLVSIMLILFNRIRACFKRYKDNRGFFIAIIMFIFLGITTGIELNHKGVLTNTYILWTIFALITLNSVSDNENKEVG
ncbi:O-antigen ligase family protein [Clostridium gasigenes]|uniref:O-antigen ligase family protein n=1 Tax=Clostridium gasigenes TaxID=94869 RepID=A0A7X0SBW3_9CLOT|nr:O-antigen ligase family protein [Clostridium gasigenes]MBB6713543.1 O-antigen ligase family protein [Clostridium gasigenes]